VHGMDLCAYATFVTDTATSVVARRDK